MKPPPHPINQSMRLCILGCLVTLYFLTPSSASFSEGRWRVPTYSLGCMITGWGAIQLLIRTKSFPQAMGLCRLAVALVLVQLYFSPFYYWWVRLPTEDFFTLNVGFLLISLLVFPLILLRIHAALSPEREAAETLRWIHLQHVLVLLPLVGVFYLTALNGHRHSTAWSAELSEFFRGSWPQLFPAWILASYLINLYRVWQPCKGLDAGTPLASQPVGI